MIGRWIFLWFESGKKVIIKINKFVSRGHNEKSHLHRGHEFKGSAEVSLTLKEEHKVYADFLYGPMNNRLGSTNWGDQKIALYYILKNELGRSKKVSWTGFRARILRRLRSHLTRSFIKVKSDFGPTLKRRKNHSWALSVFLIFQ